MNVQRSRTFASVLKRHRDAAALTQEELARQARLGVRTISNPERGVNKAPYRSTVRQLADALELSGGDRGEFQASALHPVEQSWCGDQAVNRAVIGLNFAVNFLREDAARDANTPLEVMVRQIDYLVGRAGIDRVGFGSDFDGVLIPNGIGDVSGLPKLMSALRDRGYDDQALSKLAHENWLRVLRKTWGE